MSRKKFSEKYITYEEWFNAQPRMSEYAKRIIRFHERFPDLSLNELRNVRLKDYNLINNKLGIQYHYILSSLIKAFYLLGWTIKDII